jgi:hypothetical protein
VSQKINDDNFGAWLLKCNPSVYDLPAQVAAGEVPEDWSVQDNYRSQRMKAGDPVVLWVTGTKKSAPSGVWAVGHLTGVADVEAQIVPGGDDDTGFWIDEDKLLQTRFFVPINVEFLDEPLTRQAVQSHPVLAGAEVFSSPAQGNPNWFTKDEWSALQTLVEPPAPSVAPSNADGPLFSDTDPVTKLAVEISAIDTVTHALEADGWQVEDHQSDNLGWDLSAVRGSARRLIEVKGRGPATSTVHITANELRAAEANTEWELAAVTSALTRPTLTWHSSDSVVEHAIAVTYRYKF